MLFLTSLPLLGWCTWAGLKKLKMLHLALQKTFLKTVFRKKNMPDLKRSRRVDTPSIFYFHPTPKTH